ncbi:MAG TPA: 50S ribosomal protein L17 [Candidatus Paceibacterota bacterium]|nr:50S ribosomal protein L17 [Candidatus Paceibacterota bacterium]
MRHGNNVRKFGRTTNQRSALLKSLARSLVIKGKITTTEARAKEIRPMVEKLVTRGKTDTVANRRLLVASLGTAVVANKLIKTAAGYSERSGGYLRITKMGPRKGDGAAMAVIEFV